MFNRMKNYPTKVWWAGLTIPRIRYVLLALLLISIWYLHPNIINTTPNTPLERIQNDIALSHDTSSYVRELLAYHNIGPDISFASRKLRYVMDAPERLQNTVVETPLFVQPFRNISIDNASFVHSDNVLDIHLKRSQRPDEINASKILYAVSTTPERFNDKQMSPLKEWARWLTDGQGNSNGAAVVVALFKASKAQIVSAQKTLDLLGINASVLQANNDFDMAARYMDLVRMMWEDPSRAQRDYFAIVDDDTFFPAPASLLKVLSAYDPKKPYYIGTFTERADWLANYKIPMAYGGAGIFLTAPTISRILDADCLARDSDGKFIIKAAEGDSFFYHCIKRHTNIVLTRFHRLFQFDMFGDPSGFYESGNQPLTIHHYKSWHHFSPHLAHLVADACGEDCVLQKFQFSDDFVLSNGYSIAQYPEGIDFDPMLYEGTFSTQGAPDRQEDIVYAQTFGMFRRSLAKTGMKRQWKLLGAVKEGNGIVKHVYVKMRKDERWVKKGREDLPARDSVVVLTWIP